FSELRRIYLWFIKKDHSDDSLARNDSFPLYAAALTFLIGVLGTALGYYVVIKKWASNSLAIEELRIGLHEPLPCLIIATALAATIVALHFMILQRLKAIGVPRKYVFDSQGASSII